MPQIENEIIWLHDNTYTFFGIAHKLGFSEEEVFAWAASVLADADIPQAGV